MAEDEQVVAGAQDIGWAIQSFLEGKTIEADYDGLKRARVERIDASDPSNIAVVLDNGQRFAVRITIERDWRPRAECI